MDKSEAQGLRIYRHSFVNKLKDNGEKKSRLCVAAFNDKNHGLFTAAPTIKRISLRLMVSISSTYKVRLNIRDVKQAFPQSKTALRRPVYMKPPPEMRIEKGKLLKVVKPLYGMPESTVHWFKTYGDYHKNELEMQQTAMDPCIWYQRRNRCMTGILSLQVDDTLFGGDEKFLSLEMGKSSSFPNSGRKEIGSKPVRFNGLDMRYESNVLIVDQAYYVKSFESATISKKDDI